MNDEDTPLYLRRLRLIILAMTMGVIVFAAIVIYLITFGGMSTRPDLANVLLAALVAQAALEIVLYFVARKLINDWLRQRQSGQAGDSVAPSDLVRAFFTISLIVAGLAEGLSLFGLVILMLTGNWLAIVAPAIGLLLIALRFPSNDKFNRFAASVTGQHWG